MCKTPEATAAGVAVAWQYRVMFDKGSVREDEWCDWRDAGKKYYDKVRADIAAGATRVQVRALYAVPPAAQTDGVREALEAAAEWCEAAGRDIGAVDGYDYRSGEEYGLRRAAIELRKRRTSEHPRSPQDSAP